jgi:hypothetical protein
VRINNQTFFGVVDTQEPMEIKLQRAHELMDFHRKLTHSTTSSAPPPPPSILGHSSFVHQNQFNRFQLRAQQQTNRRTGLR